MNELAASTEQPRHVLIVDDDTLLVDAINSGLSSKGYLCKTAASADAALELLNRYAFDIAVIDIVLTDTDGLELTAKIRKTKFEMAIIVSTGFMDKFSYEDAMKAGASDFIRKPFRLAELVARIEHAIRHERLHAISLRDELTGLHNRRGFFTLAEHLLKTATRRQEGLCMLYSDLDGLKKINDAMGHQKGDQALIDTAHILKETFRGSDIIARIGGDEFAVMPIENRGNNLEIVINRLKKAVEIDNATRNRDYTLSISTGMAYFDPLSPCTIDELLSMADRGMYEQKRTRTYLGSANIA